MFRISERGRQLEVAVISNDGPHDVMVRLGECLELRSSSLRFVRIEAIWCSSIVFAS